MRRSVPGTELDSRLPALPEGVVDAHPLACALNQAHSEASNPSQRAAWVPRD
jgi:hypothetical protein